jgi:hypothetical protein
MKKDPQEVDASPSAESSAPEQNRPITLLAKHLEIFAQSIADGYTVREAAKQCGRAEGSGGYLNSLPDVQLRVAEIRRAMAKAAEEVAASEMGDQIRSVNITREDVMEGLADIARNGRSESARVAAYNSLADILIMKARNIRDVQYFYGWTTLELKSYAETGVRPERFRHLKERTSLRSKRAENAVDLTRESARP